MKRSVVVLVVIGLVAAVFAASPAEAKKKKKKPKGTVCAPFSPVEPNSNSGETAEALEADVVPVTQAHSEDSPLTIEYEHGPALWETATQTPVHEDTAFFNIQVAPPSPSIGLYVKQEWGSPSFSDMDLYIYDSTGEQVFNSGSANLPEPLGGPGGLVPTQETGAQGYESVSGVAVTQCSGFTIESRAFSTAGESMTLKVWLGPIVS